MPKNRVFLGLDVIFFGTCSSQRPVFPELARVSAGCSRTKYEGNWEEVLGILAKNGENGGV